MKECVMCPRNCSVDRAAGERGFCGVGNEFVIGSADLHFWEEPCISGKRGSGAIFFSGCNLRCVFCQNKDISREIVGKKYTESELISKMLELQERGAHNINLVTATPYSLFVAHALEKAKKDLKIPVVYNCGGYESIEALRTLDGLVDIYLPDFKYYDEDIANKYSSAPNYAEISSKALIEMHRQVGKLTLDENGIATRGLIVRHLVLPSHREDSKAVLKHITEILPVNDVTLSLMRQYTPDFADESAPKNLKRRLTSFEYDDVLNYALSLGFDGFSQAKDSAKKDFTPEFNKR
ncbi:MAG: radical SAM protein [Clostridia bacterium]|nr:radical SAM protein [Clostridia bacterium]